VEWGWFPVSCVEVIDLTQELFEQEKRKGVMERKKLDKERKQKSTAVF